MNDNVDKPTHGTWRSDSGVRVQLIPKHGVEFLPRWYLYLHNFMAREVFKVRHRALMQNVYHARIWCETVNCKNEKQAKRLNRYLARTQYGKSLKPCPIMESVANLPRGRHD